MMLTQFLNPILDGDYPDPSVLRIGADYYMTNSSLPYAPGLLIWHSRNLIDWQPLVRALRCYDGDVWAAELVHHRGTFFIYYPTGRKNHVIHAPAIEGPWSEPIDLHVEHIDPGHIVGPDGVRYLHLSGGHIVELTQDGLATNGQVRKVYQGWPVPSEWRIEGDCLESPKLIFRDGWYYMLVAHGGTAGPFTSHVIVHARSRNPTGPRENSPLNPIVRTQSRDEKRGSRGHGTLIDTPIGQWWIIYHAYQRNHQNLGRSVLLEPVEWTDAGWLRTPAGSDPAKPLSRPAGEVLNGTIERSDDFASPILGIGWQFWAEYDTSRFIVGNGQLRISGKGTSPADSSPLTCISGTSAYTIEVDVTIEADAEAGMVLFYSPDCFTAIALSRRGIRIAIRGKMLHCYLPFTDDRATLRIVNNNDEVDFWYGPTGKELVKVRESVDVTTYQHNGFGGYLSLRPGLFCAGNGTATFRKFMYQEQQ